MHRKLTLVSHHLCPYVQRAAIAAGKLGIEFARVSIDLAAKPDWFLAMSPTGKVPLLQVEQADGRAAVLFESAAIAEYLNDIAGGALLAADPLDRARQRAWIEFASGTLADLAGLYSAPDQAGFDQKCTALGNRLRQLEAVVAGPWFAGGDFTLVDAAFGPVFRYFDLLESRLGLRLADDLATLAAWRANLAADQVVRDAVGADYPARLAAFMAARGTWISGLMQAAA